MINNLLRKIFSTANDRIIKKLQKEIININDLEEQYSSLTDAELKNKTIEFKEALKNGKNLDDLTYDAFATVREAAKRVLGMRHFDVQLIGGLILHRGNITEMKTGEGKTLVATLPAYLNALTEKGVHVVTVNDYLAHRDAEWMGEIFRFLGLTVGCITAGISEEERKNAYSCDITYATNNELGFDYLRDNMKYSTEQQVCRPINYAIIDEVDSILIDEARTPLIISGPVEDNTELYYVLDKLVHELTAEEYDKDEKSKTVNLNDQGINKIETLLLGANLIKENTSLYDFDNLSLVHYINQALRAHTLFKKDVDYLVKDNQVMLIDEFTGRVMEGRRFSEGLHQALEAKENVTIQNENQTLASITFQNYFRMYNKLSGMTGSAMTEANELKDIYNLDVIAVPSNRKNARIDHEDEIYGTLQEKYNAILKHIDTAHQKGQPILIGTVSIEKSEEIAALLKKANIKHNVLNAKNHDREAHIIAQAGRKNAVTVATNMAGRGTDIKLGGNIEMLAESLDKSKLSQTEYDNRYAKLEQQVEAEKQEVLQAGGLLVIATERHESRRIDNQLRGRAGRQGDPGETKFYLSLEDDLMRIFASEKISGILRTLGLKDGEAIQHSMVSRSLEKAQTKVEANNYEIRKNLLKFDNVMNDQRTIIYDQRHDIMSSDSVDDIFEDMRQQLNEEIVAEFIPEGAYREQWNIESLINKVNYIYGIKLNNADFTDNDIDEKDIIKLLNEQSHKLFAQKLDQYGSQLFNEAQKHILLVTLDQVWKEHLLQLDHLRQGISLRAYGQRDPLNEYKKEAFNLFEFMLDRLKELFIQRISHLDINLDDHNTQSLSLKNKRSQQKTFEGRTDPSFKDYNAGHAVETSLKPVITKVAPEERDPANPESWGKVSRNENCPCGSGKKFKHCHGLN